MFSFSHTATEGETPSSCPLQSTSTSQSVSWFFLASAYPLKEMSVISSSQIKYQVSAPNSALWVSSGPSQSYARQQVVL